MDIKRVLASAPRDHDPGAARPLLTRWGEALDPETVRGEHPRPQFARDRFISLNGWWDYAFVPMGAHRTVRCVRRAHPRARLARVSAVGGGSPASA